MFFSALLFSMMSFAGEHSVTISFADKAQRTVYTTDQQVWEQNGIIVTNDKSESTTNVGDYANPVRFYKGSALTVKCTLGTIKKMEFTCGTYSGKDYPADLVASVGSEATADGLVVTIIPTTSSDTYNIAKFTNQVRVASITVTYEGDAPETPEEPETPVTPPTGTDLEIPAEAQGWNIPAEAIDVLQAREICAALASGATTGKKYYVMGYVKKIHNKHADGIANYGNAQFYMENVKGANSSDDFMAYQVYGLNGQKITDPNAVAVGDFVVVYGELTNYMGNTYETVGKGAAYIWNSTNPLLTGGETPTPPTPPTDLVGDGTAENPYTVEDVLALNNTSKGPHYAKGIIIGHVNGNSIQSGLDTEAPFEPSTNSDGTVATQGTNLMIASVMGETTNIVAVQLPKGELRDAFNLVENPDMLGMEVLICGNLEKYFGVPGIKSPTSIEVIGGDNGDVVHVKGLSYADASYMEEDGATYWEFQLYNPDEATEEKMVPIVLLGVEAKSKTALNGTYDMFDAFYGDSIDVDTYDLFGIAMDAETVGTLTIKNVNEEGDYSFVGSFVGEDGKTYKINTVANVYAMDGATEEIIELKEEDTDEPGDDPVTPPAEGVITCAEAVAICEATGSTLTTETYTIRGYVTEIKYAWSEQYGTATFWIADTKDGGKVLQAYSCAPVTDADKEFAVGAYVELVGKLKQYNTTSEVERGTYTVITPADGGTGVEDIMTVEVPVKVIENGQLMIIRGENVYNVLGAQVK